MQILCQIQNSRFAVTSPYATNDKLPLNVFSMVMYAIHKTISVMDIF